jgi:DNA invertase Pin-like site-specific DNA recombinase
MFQMMGVFAEFERAMIRERVLAGLARAKEQGTTLGRPQLENSDPDKVTAIKAALTAKWGLRRIARAGRGGLHSVQDTRRSALNIRHVSIPSRLSPIST